MPCWTRYQIKLAVTEKNKAFFIQMMREAGLTIILPGEKEYAYNLQIARLAAARTDVIFYKGRLGANAQYVDGYVDLTAGVLSDRDEKNAGLVTNEYARRAVTTAAKRFGWLSESEGDTSIKLKRRG